MAEYQLSRQAEVDLLNIYEFTEAKFGQYQADAYHAGFERSFGLLADFPRTGASADELVAKFRRFRFQAHYIFYTEESDQVFIRPLIHFSMNLRPDYSNRAQRGDIAPVAAVNERLTTSPARLRRPRERHQSRSRDRRNCWVRSTKIGGGPLLCR